ncbi:MULTISPECIES: cytochrome c oxidase assembly protein [unclassified Caulobacter]|uniref:cytochrome c oxidase assembly protein n=1 Tax=unclassified Caulobacter TaxID=2648921 RepID=UPI000D3701A4|nr:MULTISPECIES: cytochrome c oxidase assembly protein [unclassified Caulobacter]PTS90031.1 cytochrome c oxidase assembly protein [Caulobacter sp. HMWF009]PTT08897.1 cytochrome c oxidase assembly protein [Caulobacter sp. HMWF025]
MSRIVPSDPVKALAGKRNARVALICAAAFFGMVGAAYASVPLYKLFCQMTGFDGTVRKAELAPTRILDRKVTIRFDSNIRELPWSFSTEQTSQQVRIGDTGLAFFKVTNNSDKAMTGRAIYNVVPEQAGPYFQKLECFCFSNQTIAAGQTVEFPVVYFVDPQYADDPETKGKGEITLSYTFFPAVLDDPKQKQTASTTPRIVQPLGGAPSRGL